jgi:hypothetical protein
MPHCEQSSISVGIICWKKSGRIRSRHFIKRLWASQASENIFYKTKVVPFEKLILKKVNKMKIFNQVMALLRKYVFLSFSRFYWFWESCNFVNSEGNFKLKKLLESLVQALSKTFNTFFCKIKSSCPKLCVNASTAPDFRRGSVYQQRMSGGGECEDVAFSTVYMPI